MRFTREESEYKVTQILPPLMELAKVDQSGVNVSVDMRIYFRWDANDNTFKGEFAFLDPETGKIVHRESSSTSTDTLPMPNQERMLWFLGLIVRQGFDFVRLRMSNRSEAA